MTLQLSAKLFQVHAANKNRAPESLFLLSPLYCCLCSQSDLGTESADFFSDSISSCVGLQT